MNEDIYIYIYIYIYTGNQYKHAYDESKAPVYYIQTWHFSNVSTYICIIMHK